MGSGSYRTGLARGRHNIGESKRNRGVFHTILTLLLAIALVVTLVVSAPSLRFKAEYRALTIERMQKECDSAISTSRYLSRTASSNSNEQLSVIRANVYAISILNETYAGLNGGQYLLEPTLMSDVIGMIDNYYNKLTTGNNTSDEQTQLSNLLEALQTAAAALN